MELNPIEYCTRHKLRFQTNKGLLDIETLWDLPLTSDAGKANLNDIAKGIHSTLKRDETTFVEAEGQETGGDGVIMLDAVKRIIAVRQADRKASTEAKVKSAKRQELLEALAASEGRALQTKTPEEIRAMIAAL